MAYLFYHLPFSHLLSVYWRSNMVSCREQADAISKDNILKRPKYLVISFRVWNLFSILSKFTSINHSSSLSLSSLVPSTQDKNLRVSNKTSCFEGCGVLGLFFCCCFFRGPDWEEPSPVWWGFFCLCFFTIKAAVPNSLLQHMGSLWKLQAPSCYQFACKFVSATLPSHWAVFPQMIVSSHLH